MLSRLTGRTGPEAATGFKVVLQLPLDRILFAAVRAFVSLLGVTVQDVLRNAKAVGGKWITDEFNKPNEFKETTKSHQKLLTRFWQIEMVPKR